MKIRSPPGLPAAERWSLSLLAAVRADEVQCDQYNRYEALHVQGQSVKGVDDGSATPKVSPSQKGLLPIS